MANVAVNPNDPNIVNTANTPAPVTGTPNYARPGQPGYGTSPTPDYSSAGQPAGSRTGTPTTPDLVTKTGSTGENGTQGAGLTQGPASWQTELANFQTMADATAKKLGEGGYDPAQQQRYYEEAKAPIESDFYNSANQTASYLARQGMGSSQGLNLSATSQLNQQRSSLESQANLKATDLAQELQRRSLLDAFSTEAMKTNTDLQSHGIDVSSTIAQMQIQAQMDMLQKQLDAQSAAGTGSLIGTAAGIALPFGLSKLLG